MKLTSSLRIVFRIQRLKFNTSITDCSTYKGTRKDNYYRFMGIVR